MPGVAQGGSTGTMCTCVSWPGQLSHATTKAVTVVWNQTLDVFLSLSKTVPGPPCLEPDNNSLMRPVKA